MTVDGTEVAAVDGSYLVTAGDDLAAGATKAHTVVVTYTVDQAQITAEGWKALGTCDANDTDTVGKPELGLYNKVDMDGDADVEKQANNDACVPVTAQGDFAVAKSTTDDGVTLEADTTEMVRNYVITVTNQGRAAGTSPEVIDTPQLPKGFTITSVTVDGADVEVVDGSFQVTAGDQLAAGASQAHVVDITFAIDQSQIDKITWQVLGSCSTELGAELLDHGLYNLVTMSGDADGVDNNDVCSPVVGEPGIEIKKFINGDDAETAPGVAVKAGSMMDITYVVTNTGVVPLTDVQVTDDKVAASAITCPKSELAPGEQMTCTASLVAPKAGVQHTNVGTVVGTPPAEDPTPENPNPDKPKPVTDDDKGNAHVPSITIVKKINGDDANTKPGVQVALGSTMQITYEVTNTGVAPLTGVKVTDDKVADQAIKCPKTALAAGETMVCTASLAAPKAGVQHTNVGTVVGTPPATPKTPENPNPEQPKPVTDEDPANAHSVDKPAAITIVKSINGDDANTAPGVAVEAGKPMEITYVVTNTGAVTLSDVTVSDDKVAAADIECPKTVLKAGEQMTCTATLVAPKAGSQHTNVGTVVGTPPAGPDGKTPKPVTDEDPANAWTPAVKIVKSINGDDAESAPGVAVKEGSMMEVEYLVTNTGKGALTKVAVTDDKVAASAITCPKAELAAGESMTCTATLKAPKAGEQHVNVGTVVAEPKLPAGPGEEPGEAGFTVTDSNKAHAHVAGHLPNIAKTGADVSPWALGVGALLVLGGGLALVLGRRRKQDN